MLEKLVLTKYSCSTAVHVVLCSRMHGFRPIQLYFMPKALRRLRQFACKSGVDLVVRFSDGQYVKRQSPRFFRTPPRIYRGAAT